MRFERAADEIVGNYRELEGMLRDAPEGSAEASKLRDRIDELRAEYLALTSEADKADDPLVPMPWPGDVEQDESTEPKG